MRGLLVRAQSLPAPPPASMKGQGADGGQQMAGWAWSRADAQNGSSGLLGADWGGEGSLSLLILTSPVAFPCSATSGIPAWLLLLLLLRVLQVPGGSSLSSSSSGSLVGKLSLEPLLLTSDFGEHKTKQMDYPTSSGPIMSKIPAELLCFQKEKTMKYRISQQTNHQKPLCPDYAPPREEES